jgi:hypothetical protein
MVTLPCKLAASMTIEYSRGFYQFGDDILNWLNSLDSTEMEAKDVRSAITHKILDMRPRREYNGRSTAT